MVMELNDDFTTLTFWAQKHDSMTCSMRKAMAITPWIQVTCLETPTLHSE